MCHMMCLAEHKCQRPPFFFFFFLYLSMPTQAQPWCPRALWVNCDKKKRKSFSESYSVYIEFICSAHKIYFHISLGCVEITRSFIPLRLLLYARILCRLGVYGGVACQSCLSPYFLKPKKKKRRRKRRLKRSWAEVGGTVGGWERERERKVDCVHADVLSMPLCPHYFRLDGSFRSAVFIPAYIHNCGCKAEVKRTIWQHSSNPWKSKLCLWITIHQNEFPVRPRREALIGEEHLSSPPLTPPLLSSPRRLSHFFLGRLSDGHAVEPGLYLVCPLFFFFFFDQSEGYIT